MDSPTKFLIATELHEAFTAQAAKVNQTNTEILLGLVTRYIALTPFQRQKFHQKLYDEVPHSKDASLHATTYRIPQTIYQRFQQIVDTDLRVKLSVLESLMAAYLSRGPGRALP